MTEIDIAYPRVFKIGDGISIPDKFIFKISPNKSPIEIDKDDYKLFRRRKEIRGLYERGKLKIEVPDRPDEASDSGGVPSDLLLYKDKKILQNPLIPNDKKTEEPPTPKAEAKVKSKDSPKSTKILKSTPLPASPSTKQNSNLVSTVEVLKIAKNLNTSELNFLIALVQHGQVLDSGKTIISSSDLEKFGVKSNKAKAARTGLKEKGFLDYEWANDPNHPKNTKRFYYTLLIH